MNWDLICATWQPRVLSLLRVVAGLMIIQHGMSKLFHFPDFPAYANVQLYSLIGAAGVIELVGGALLILGLLTRPAAFVLAGEMALHISSPTLPGGSIRFLTAALSRSCIASPFSISRLLAAARGALMR